jgi:hypothetical protein
MKPDKDEACYLLEEVLDRTFTSFVPIKNTLRYVEEAVNFSSDHIANVEVENSYERMINLLGADVMKNTPQEFVSRFQKSVPDRVKAEFPDVLRRTASAALVFAHAIFEDCIHTCLKISFCAAPEDWLSEIKKRKIAIEDTLDKSIDIIYRQEIENYLKDLERKSIVIKLETLFRIIRPSKDHPKMYPYTYDLEKIRQIDEARHTATHKNPLSYDPSILQADVNYLQSTVLYILSLLIGKYKIEEKIRPSNKTL